MKSNSQITRYASSLLPAIVLFTLGLSWSAHAVPAYGVPLQVKQPDGTIVDVWVWGDEDFRFMEDSKGYALIRDTITNEICYAKLSADKTALESTGTKIGSVVLPPLNAVKDLHLDPGALFTSVTSVFRAAPRGAASRAIPVTTGTRNVLCLVIDFPDGAGSVAASEITNYFNQTGYTGFQNNGSVRDFYFDVSNGNLTLTHEVHGYYRAQNNRSFYDTPSKEASGAAELITEALRGLQGEIDFTKFDSNSDGMIDAITVLYAGNMPAENNHPLWPHRWDIRGANPAQSFTSSSGKSAGPYMICNIGQELTIGVVCHELGHLVCGFTDYYDTSFNSEGLGEWCLMASGNWNGGAKNPAPPHNYLRWKAGWLTPVAASSSITSLACTLTDVIKFDNAGNSKEFFVISAIQKTGRNAGLPGEGLAIFHIDEAKTKNNEPQHTASQHYQSSLEQADGLFNLESKGASGNRGDNKDPFSQANGNTFTDVSTVSAKWWNGADSGFSITNIGASGGTSISFTMLGSGGGGGLTVTSGPTASPNPATANQQISFSVAASDPTTQNLTYTWNFGDGSTASGASVTHTYAANGNYSVSVTVDNNAGTTTSRTLTVTVSDSLPATVTLAKFTLNFRTGKDNWDMRFQHSDFLYTDRTLFQTETNGSAVKVFIGTTEVETLTLLKGKARALGTLTWNGKKAEIRYVLRNYSLQTILQEYGAVNDNASGQVTVPVAISIDGLRYSGEYTFFYTASAQKTGKGKPF
jgi:M6 family metalloprotease-like protein